MLSVMTRFRRAVTMSAWVLPRGAVGRAFGGAREDRTPDLLRAKQALSQLSYGPEVWWVWVDLNHRPHPYQGCALTN